jgi:hypothetical protein
MSLRTLTLERQGTRFPYTRSPALHPQPSPRPGCANLTCVADSGSAVWVSLSIFRTTSEPSTPATISSRGSLVRECLLSLQASIVFPQSHTSRQAIRARRQARRAGLHQSPSHKSWKSCNPPALLLPGSAGLFKGLAAWFEAELALPPDIVILSKVRGGRPLLLFLPLLLQLQLQLQLLLQLSLLFFLSFPQGICCCSCLCFSGLSSRGAAERTCFLPFFGRIAQKIACKNHRGCPTHTLHHLGHHLHDGPIVMKVIPACVQNSFRSTTRTATQVNNAARHTHNPALTQGIGPTRRLEERLKYSPPSMNSRGLNKRIF